LAFHRVDKRLGSELAALVGVDDVRLAIVFESLFEMV
jgi:hypothetical protein